MIDMIPQYNTVTFSDIYPSVTKFINGYENPEGQEIIGYMTNPYGTPIEVSPFVNNLYYMLYAQYGNNPIANNDIYQFQIKLFTILIQYGPTWVKKSQIQTALRNLSEEDMLKGSKALYNHAYNPSTSPSMDAETALTYINDQNTTSYKKSKMEGYANLYNLLNDRIDKEFVDKFKHLFKQFVNPEQTLLYVTEEDE